MLVYFKKYGSARLAFWAPAMDVATVPRIFTIENLLLSMLFFFRKCHACFLNVTSSAPFSLSPQIDKLFLRV